jgi:allantoin racemase
MNDFINMNKHQRLLVINPNTSVMVTESFVNEARRYLPAGATIEGVTGTFGAAIVSTQAENAVAGHAALDLIAAHASGYDAVILAISFDTALGAAREVLNVPVVGITESALLEASAQGGKIGLVTFGSVSNSLYDELLVRYRLDERVAAIETIEVTAAADYLGQAGRDEAVVESALRLTARSDVAAIVICGAAVVGIARRLQHGVPAPLFDGAGPSVAAALRQIEQGTTIRIPPRPLSGTRGLSPALTKLIAGIPA